MMRAMSAPFMVLTQTNSTSKLKTFHNASTLQENEVYYDYYAKAESSSSVSPYPHRTPSSSFARVFRVQLSQFETSTILRTLSYIYNNNDDYSNMIKINKTLILSEIK